MTDTWEGDIADLLTQLASVQGDLLSALADKRRALAAGNHDALAPLAERERLLANRLQACHDRRQQLLARAAGEGLPADSIRTLSSALPAEGRGRLQADIDAATHRSRLLQHQSLTNWVLVQRTLLHLSQMVEIIATGGRAMPTYGNGSDRPNGGILVDRAV